MQVGGTGNEVKGFYSPRPDGMTSRICGSVGKRTCNFDGDLKATIECLRVVIRRQRQESVVTRSEYLHRLPGFSANSRREDVVEGVAEPFPCKSYAFVLLALPQRTESGEGFKFLRDSSCTFGATTLVSPPPPSSLEIVFAGHERSMVQ
ncbi:hypothetical protein PoB_005921400 [Plakobranchus ocellatus]|uniref:Uncharacterized protein n=1 Tax=Plakobranchus ocellatus TaxID=259542 RepID=A0AAV4CMQ0_9GAST|nr:hypothetical protein PoB_005921400 [Plakobranchus ocellatus]